MVRSCWLVASIVSLSVVAAAQPADAPPPTEASKLFEEGRVLAKDGKYTEACEKFQKSYQLDRGVGTEVNLGDCHEHLGHLAEAWRLFDDAALQSAATNPARAKFARERADALVPKLGTVVLEIPAANVTGAIVSIGGRNVSPAAEIKEHVDPGAVEIIVTAPKQTRFIRSERVTAGATVTVDAFAPGADKGGKPLEPNPNPAPQAGTDEPGPRQRSRVYLAIGLGAAGGLSLVTAIAFGATARSHYNTAENGPDCDKVGTRLTCTTAGTNAIHDAQTLADFGTGFGIAAVALGIGATVIYFTAPREAAVAPVVTPTSVGVAISARF
jgi:hypothetical protein